MTKDKPDPNFTDPDDIVIQENTPVVETPPARKLIPIDFEAFLAAEEAESAEGLVDAVLIIPVFDMTDAGQFSVAPDQTGEVEVRVAPKLGAAALDAIIHAGIGLNAARVLEALIHPADVGTFRARIRDVARPIPTNWIAQATTGVLSAHGIGSHVEPGKGSSPPNG